MRYLKDGTERVVQFATRPADFNAITITATTGEWTVADDHSGGIVKPLNITASDSNRFTFNTIDTAGNGERAGRSNAAGTVRIVREYAAGDTKQIDPAADTAFIAFGTKDTEVLLGIYRGPKLDGVALAAGDEYEYYEFTTDVPKVVEETDQYICYDVALIFSGTMTNGPKVLVA